MVTPTPASRVFARKDRNCFIGSRKVYSVVLVSACGLVFFKLLSGLSVETTRAEQSPMSSKKSTRQRITFLLQDSSVRYQNTFGSHVYSTMCQGREPLHPEIVAGLGNFYAASVKTDLKIVFVGDSVTFQFYQIFEEAVGSLSVFRETFGNSKRDHQNEKLALSRFIDGGGAVAGMKIQGVLDRASERKGKQISPSGWKREDARALNRQFVFSLKDGVERKERIARYDVCITRIPHGWQPFRRFAEASFVETTELAHELFGASTIIFISIPYTNNIVAEDDLHMQGIVNNRLRKFAAAWEPGRSGVDRVLVLEFGEFIASWMEKHAQLLGYDTTDRRNNYALDALEGGSNSALSKSIVQLCAERVPSRSKDCKRNAVSADGMHWCMSTIGGPVVAGLACLLGCHFNEVHDSVPECATKCNERFMRLNWPRTK